MHWDLRVLTAPSNDTDLSIIVTFDHAKYLFNCGEGTQRSFVQRKLSMKKLNGVFFTSGDVEVVAGLPGLIMSAADAGVRSLKVGGPRHIAQHLVSCRTFLQRDNITVDMLDVPEDPSVPMLSEPHLNITAVKLQRPWKRTTRKPRQGGSGSGGEAPAARVSETESLRSESESAGERPMAATDADLMDTRVPLHAMSASQLGSWRKMVIGSILHAKTAVAEPPKAETAVDEEAEMNVIAAPKRAPWANPDGNPSASRRRMGEVMPLFGSEEKALEMNPSYDRVAYILQAPMVRGKFDNAKAKALQVPNGPLRKNLTSGETIQFEVDGPSGKEIRIVKAEDVLGAAKNGGACVIVDAAPTYLPGLIASAELGAYRKQGNQASPKRLAHTVVHRGEGDFLRSPAYREWMQSFGPATHHLLADTKGYSDTVTFTSSAWNLVKMSMLDEKIFAPVITGNPTERKADNPIPTSGASVQAAVSDLEIRLMPPSDYKLRPSVIEGPEYPHDPAELGAAKEFVAASAPEYLGLVKQTQKGQPAEAELDQPENYGIEVFPLGTGSAIPSKYRNVSSTLLRVPGFGDTLLDAGEGTLGQLRRRFGMAGLRDVYANLRLIFISHMHADHHMGLRALLLDRAKTNPKQTLYVIAPSFILLYFNDNGLHIGDAWSNVRFIDSFHCGALDRKLSSDSERYRRHWSTSKGMVFRHTPNRWSRDRSLETLKTFEQEGNLRLLRAVEVNHRGRAWGLTIEHNTGWKIAYSGDTMPCQALVEAGEDSTLLIHEATLEDDKPEVAAAKGHSTFGQAIDIGIQMKAKYILLNHFSQRYPKLPVLQQREDTSGTVGPRIAMAFDLMHLPLKDFKKASTYIPALETLFVDDDGVDSEGESAEMSLKVKQTEKLRKKADAGGNRQGLEGTSAKGKKGRTVNIERNVRPRPTATERAGSAVSAAVVERSIAKGTAGGAASTIAASSQAATDARGLKRPVLDETQGNDFVGNEAAKRAKHTIDVQPNGLSKQITT